MRNTKHIAAALFLLAGLSACPDEGGVTTLTAGLEVEPAALDVSPLWAGHPRSVALSVRNRGAASLAGLLARVDDVTGPAAITAVLEGDALAPGAQLTLTVSLFAEDGAVGPSSATVVVDAGGDGRVLIPVSATVLLPPSCDDGSPCTVDRFDPAAGRCLHEPLVDGAACDDGSACTSGDSCLAGRCLGTAVSCGDNVACTLDFCDPAVGCVYEPIHSRCADEDPCTDDVCAPGAGCQNPPREEGAVCHFGGCEEIGLCFGGACERFDVPDGMPCEDGDACTAEDTCQSGSCAPGRPLGDGAAPPLAFAPSEQHVDLCAGPDPVSACFGYVPELGLARVLTADRQGDQVRLVWQGEYVDAYGSPCDPTDPLFAPLAMDTPGEEPPPAEDPGGAMVPAAFMCGAGVYLSTLDLGSAVQSPVTRQLTVVRGPAAAAFVPPSGALASAAPSSGGASDSDAEAPAPPMPPPMPAAEVVIAHPDFLRSSLWLEQRDRHGTLAASPEPIGPWPLFGAIASLAVDIDEQAIALVAAPDRQRIAQDVCEAETGCEPDSDVPLWTLRRARAPGSLVVAREVALQREPPYGCTLASELPVVVDDLAVFARGQVLQVALRMSASPCGAFDAASRTHRGWWFAIDPSVANDGAAIPPLVSLSAEDGGLGAFSVTREGEAALLQHVEEPCEACAPCADPSLECACDAVETTCFSTLIQRTADVVTAPPEALLVADGVPLAGQVAPLFYEGELRVATLLAPHVELLGTGPGDTLSRLTAPPPAAPLSWDLTAPLFAGPPESHVVVGTGREATDASTRRHALVQVFGCGLGSGPAAGACLEEGDCALDEGCDRSVCLPAPDCAALGTCDLCYGQCVPLADDDAGAPDAGDAGAEEPDGGAG